MQRLRRFVAWLVRPAMHFAGYGILLYTLTRVYELIREVTTNTQLFMSQNPIDEGGSYSAVALISYNFEKSVVVHSTLFEPVTIFNSRVLWCVLYTVIGTLLLYCAIPRRSEPVIQRFIYPEYSVKRDGVMEKYFWWGTRIVGYLLSMGVVVHLFYLLSY